MARKKKQRKNSTNNLNSSDKEIEITGESVPANSHVTDTKQKGANKSSLISPTTNHSHKMTSRVTFSPNVTVHHLNDHRTNVNKKNVSRVKCIALNAIEGSPSKGILKSSSKSYILEPWNEFDEIKVDSQSQIAFLNIKAIHVGDFLDTLKNTDENGY